MISRVFFSIFFVCLQAFYLFLVFCTTIQSPDFFLIVDLCYVNYSLYCAASFLVTKKKIGRKFLKSIFFVNMVFPTYSILLLGLSLDGEDPKGHHMIASIGFVVIAGMTSTITLWIVFQIDWFTRLPKLEIIALILLSIIVNISSLLLAILLMISKSYNSTFFDIALLQGIFIIEAHARFTNILHSKRANVKYISLVLVCIECLCLTVLLANSVSFDLELYFGKTLVIDEQIELLILGGILALTSIIALCTSFWFVFLVNPQEQDQD